MLYKNDNFLVLIPNIDNRMHHHPPILKRQNATVSNRRVTFLLPEKVRTSLKIPFKRVANKRPRKIRIRYDTKASGEAHGCKWKIILSYRDYRDGKSEFRDTPKGQLVFFNIYVNDHPEIDTPTQFQTFIKSDPNRVTHVGLCSAYIKYVEQF